MFTTSRFAQGKGTLPNRLITCLAFLLLSVTWLYRPAMLAAAQDMDLLYEENFDSGEVPDGWKLETSNEGGWWMESGMLYGVNHVWAEYRKAEWGSGPYSLEFDLVKLDPNSGGVHINVQHSDVGRYLIGLRRVDTNDAEHLYVYLERNVWNYPPEQLASTAGHDFNYVAGVNYRVRIDFGDGQFSVYLNKHGEMPGAALTSVITAQDPKPLPPGGISFESMGKSSVWVDNVAVYGPQPQPVPPSNQPRDPAPPPENAPPVPEYGQCYDEKLLYADDFEDGRAQGWNLDRGWSVGNGGMQGKGHYFADYPAASWEDLTLYVIFSQPKGGGELHINARKSDSGRYFVNVSAENISLDKQVKWGPGEQFFNLTYRNLPVEPEVWHTLALAVHGGIIQVALDGRPQLEAKDDQPLPAGGISLETLDNSFVLIESIWVCGTPVIAPPPPPSPPQLPDLTINAIEAQDFDPAAMSQELMVAVRNAGDAVAESSQIRVLGVDGEENYYAFESLAPGEETQISVGMRIPNSLLGQSARFEAVVDPDNQIRERNERNNGLQSAAIEFPAPPPPLPPPAPEPDWPIIIGGGLLGLVIIFLIGRAIWRRPQKGQGDEQPEEPQGLPPVLPPVRLLNLWLTEGGSGQGRRINDDQPLVSGADYCLHAQIVTNAPQQPGRSPTQSSQAPVPLQAVVYSPSTDFTIQNRRIGLNLPADGSSEPTFWPIQANEPGLRRARVCLYYGNLLLQSAFVDAEVVTQNRRSTSPSPGLQRMLDYVANASLTGLERFPQPTVSIFTNHTGHGEGWVGVYAAGDPITGFGDGLLRLVNQDRLSARARVARQQLLEVEEAYNYAQLSPDGRSRERQISRLEQDLAALACNGWTLYDELFLQSSQGTKQEKIRFDQALRPPGVVAIDRCRSDSTTLPWAAIYDLEVDTGKEDLLKLCPVFKAELAAHWSEDMAQYQTHPDWLDNPQGCRLNPRCPLSGEDELLTICPLAFWGFRHQISQPLQTVQPTPVGQVPAEISQPGEGGGSSSFDSTIFLQRRRDERLKLAIGVHPGLSQANRLPVDITALSPNEIEITFESTRDRVLELLKQGGFHLYILYCHGDRDESDQKFKLVFGPPDDERSITCDNLNPLKISWPQQPKPLVILNGCETVAVTPETVHGLLDRMHELGAAGVVGTEIQVYPSLAYPFGLVIIERLLHGTSLGEAFLLERKELLRKFSPLGLAYTYYAPAALHLHLQGECAWCAKHQVPQFASEVVQPR